MADEQRWFEQDPRRSAAEGVPDESLVPPSSPAPEDSAPAVKPPSVAVLRERVRRIDPELDPASTTFGAALLLLAGLHLDHNVVKLARFTGLPPELVARCARRLVDNGIWRGGGTVAGWREDSLDERAFWADVAVAEGKLCRRLDGEGRPQWAPGGHWWKSFDLVNHTPGEQSVLYHSPPPAPPATDPLPLLDDDLDDDAEESEAADEREIPAADGFLTAEDAALPRKLPQAANPPPDSAGEDEEQDENDDSGFSPPAPAGEEATSRPRPGNRDLFPDAVWL